MASKKRSESPEHKRARLSSPTYDDQFELTQDAVHAFDAFESTCAASQRMSLGPKPSQVVSESAKRKRTEAISRALAERSDRDPPSSFSPPGLNVSSSDSKLKSSSQPSIKGFAPASTIPQYVREDSIYPSSSPETEHAPAAQDPFVTTGTPDSHAATKKSRHEQEEEDWWTAPAPLGAPSFKSARLIDMSKLNEEDDNEHDDNFMDSSFLTEPMSNLRPEMLDFRSAKSIPQTCLGFTSAKLLDTSDEHEYNVLPPNSSSLPGLLPAVGFQFATALSTTTGTDGSISIETETTTGLSLLGTSYDDAAQVALPPCPSTEAFASNPPFTGFASAKSAHTAAPTSLSTFAPASVSSALSSASISTAPTLSSFAPASASFTTASAAVAGQSKTRVREAKKPEWLAKLTTEALAKAEAKMKMWEAEIDSELSAVASVSAEGEREGGVSDRENSLSVRGPSVAIRDSERTVFGVVENVPSFTSTVTTPAPIPIPVTTPMIDSPCPPPAFRRTAAGPLGFGGNRKPFKSPLINKVGPRMRTDTSGYVSSPLGQSRAGGADDVRAMSPFPAFTSYSGTPPADSMIIPTTPVRVSLASELGSPKRRLALGVTPRRAGVGGMSTPMRKTPAGFVTPFKKGVATIGERRGTLAGTPVGGRDVVYAGAITNGSASGSKYISSSVGVNEGKRGASKEKEKARLREVCFNLTMPKERKTLQGSGLYPQMYSFEELQGYGINVQELAQITPHTALYYSFHTRLPSCDFSPSSSSTSPPSSSASRSPTHSLPASTHLPPQLLNPVEALKELKALGCMLATKEWVENAWALVLWKLAGMVALDPEGEVEAGATNQDIKEREKVRMKRWCWDEVMRQLRYRYERELNQGERPPLRLVAAQDVPPSSPMVLCVSDIIPGGDEAGGAKLELEVTDGWYRMRAEVDAPLERAVKKGMLRVGRKLCLVGARLADGRKDAVELAETPNADNIALKLTGNSSSLAPWHAKLGFHFSVSLPSSHTALSSSEHIPFIASLRSLTPDGGVASMLDLVVEKAYPVAYIQFVVDANGKKRQEGPRNERDEERAEDRWRARRDVAAAKIREQTEKKLRSFEGYIGRLERKAGTFRPNDDHTPPPKIDDLLMELEDASPHEVDSLIWGITHEEAGWLARAILEKCVRERENMRDMVEREVDEICPPREVRSFRVLLSRDARPHSRRTPRRKAQVTVWDVHQLSLGNTEEEIGEKGGGFKEGMRFLVTNLIPSQPRSWGSPDEDSNVFLSTRRDTRWTRLQSL